LSYDSAILSSLNNSKEITEEFDRTINNTIRVASGLDKEIPKSKITNTKSI